MMDDRISRRELLKKALTLSSGVFFFGFACKAAKGALTAAGSDTKGTAGALAGLQLPDGYDPRQHYYGYAIDIDKCIGCTRCVDACKTENNVSRTEPYFRTWVERYVIRKDDTVDVTSPKGGRKDDTVEVSSPNGGLDPYPTITDPGSVVKAFFVPKMCSHCERSPCEQVCPVGASLKSPDGVVLVDKEYCIGCGYCIQACPYGCRYFDESTRTAGKCTLCYHRITRGLRPACAEVCPTGARLFGDLRDKDGPLVKFIRDHKVQVLKPHMGTRPKLFYHDLDKEVH